MDPIFYARLGVCILSVSIGKFRGDSLKFQTFEMQKLDDMTFLQIHRSETFRFLMCRHGLFSVFFYAESPKFGLNTSLSWGY
jgi:hypothetical protein